MRRAAGVFALFGFVAGACYGLLGEAGFASTLGWVLLWTAAFAVIGFIAGWAGKVLVSETAPPAEELDAAHAGAEAESERRMRELSHALVERERNKCRELVEKLPKTADNVSSHA